jgi:phosphatidylinositol alpha 1,6-mannosyltransferase
MRIALFSGNYNYLREGANQALNRLVRYSEAAGHTVRVYSPVTDTPAFEPAGTLIPVPSVTLPFRTEFRLALGLPRAIRRDLDAFRPAIIHVSTPDILDTRAQTYGLRHRIPVVASLHTRFETYLEHYGLGLARPLVEAHLKRFYRRSSHVLAPNRALAAQMMQWRGDDKVSIWSRGVDRDLFSPERRDVSWRRSLGIGDDEIVALFFGRLVLEKGVKAYCETVRLLESRGVAVRPLIVGAGPAGDILRTLPGAILTGHLDGVELARAVASADIMLNPSTTEAFGNVVLEAMASGLPIVTAHVGSTAGLIQDQLTGLLCPPDDVVAYAASMKTLVRAPPRRRTLGDAARRASLAFSWDMASQAVLDAYQTLYQAHGEAVLSGPRDNRVDAPGARASAHG